MQQFLCFTPYSHPNPPRRADQGSQPTAAWGNGFEEAEFNVGGQLSERLSKGLSTTRSEWPALPATSIKFHFPHKLVRFLHAAKEGF